MRNLLASATLLLLLSISSGCDYIAPQISKAQTEKKQLIQAQDELEVMRRIADSMDDQAASLRALVYHVTKESGRLSE